MPNHDELLDILLTNRGIAPNDRENFLNPSFDEHLHDPFLMLFMEKACVRIFEAIEAKEKIVIYSDYDCDGIPASVIMHDFFRKINYPFFIYSNDEVENVYKDNEGTAFSYGVGVYIPDRHDEGYGLNPQAVEQFIDEGINLLITFDLGITAIDEVAQAQASGIDVIITDHHLPRVAQVKAGLPRRSLGEGGQAHQPKELSGEEVQDELPRAFAILNPKQKTCHYPNKNICGAGIAFKLIQALVKKYGEYWKIKNGWEKWLLDMAGIATLADQVPLLGENRVLAYYGLKVLKKGRRPGLIELFRKKSVNINRINEEDITFTLAPHINAASRMTEPMKAFEFLSTNDPIEAENLSDYLIKINNDRKIMVAHIMKDVKKILKKREEKSIIVIGNPSWRVGILGIIASKITEEYRKPAFVWGHDGDGVIKGSCRGWGDINLVELMVSLPPQSLLGFGGHKNAGGFSVSYEEIHFLEENLLKVFNDQEKKEDSEKDYLIDTTILIDDIIYENYQIIEKLAPFGLNNPKPVFLIKNIEISNIKEFGKEKNHLELIFKNSKNKQIKAIAFFKNRTSFISNLIVGMKINLVASFEMNTFAGKNELRLRIVDII